jgi:hypothetical protein
MPGNNVKENKKSFDRTERSGVRFGGRPQGGPALLTALLLGEAIEKARTLCRGAGLVGLRLWLVSGLFGRWGGGAPFGSVADPLGYLAAAAFTECDRGAGRCGSDTAPFVRSPGLAGFCGGHRGSSCSFWLSVSSVSSGSASARRADRSATATRTSCSVVVMSGESVTVA